MTGTGTAFGTGTVYVNTGGTLRIDAPGNLRPGQVQVIAGGILALENSFNPAALVESGSAGILAVNSANHSAALNMAAVGNGQMFLGSTGAGVYTASTLGAGSDGLYRIGGGNGTLTITGTNVITGNHPLFVNDQGFNGYGKVLLTGANDYTGGTTVQAGILQVTGTQQSLGTSNAAVVQAAILRLAAPTNLAPGATVKIEAGAILAVDGNFLPPLTADSAGILAVNVAGYNPGSGTLDQSAMGNGRMTIGSLTNGTITATTIIPGLDNTYRFGAASGTLTITGTNVLTGTASLHVGYPTGYDYVRSGTLILEGDQDFSGGVLVDHGGTLLLRGTLTGGGPLTVYDLGTVIKGTGTVHSLVSVNSGATVSPGESPGVMTFASGLTMQANSHYKWELSLLSDFPADSGTGFDRIDVTGGVLTIDALTDLDLSFIGTATAPSAGVPFWDVAHVWHDIISLSGTATNAGGGAMVIDNSAWLAEGTFSTLANASGGVDLLWNPTPVPEPAVVLGLALAGLAVYARCRRRI